MKNKNREVLKDEGHSFGRTQLKDHLNQNSTLPENQEIIVQLNQRINRRINNGYYLPNAGKLAINNVIAPKKHKPKPKDVKRVHPVFKKQKKQMIKISMVDQDQNTSDVELNEQQQNTSKVMVEKEDTIVQQDQQLQWECQIQQIDQKDKSMQWSIEPIQQLHQEIQYSLLSEVVECRDASVQCSESEEEEQQQEEKKVEIVYVEVKQPVVVVEKKDIYMQCDDEPKIKCEDASLQFDQEKPKQKEINIQIQLPDPKAIQQIKKMESKVQFMKLKQTQQEKIQKKTHKKVELMKLKEAVGQLQGKIALAETKERFVKQKLQKQLKMQERQRKYVEQKQQLHIKYQRQYKQTVSQLLQKIKIPTKKRQIIKNQIDEQAIRKQEQLKKQQQSKLELQNYRNQVVNLKQQVKKQMYKRLSVFGNEQDSTEQNMGRAKTNHSLFERRGKSMGVLFPEEMVSKHKFAGVIIKNLPVPSDPQKIEQHKINSYVGHARMSRAYWRQKSPFEYRYQQNSQMRLNRKDKYMNKFSVKLQNVQFQIKNTNWQRNSQYSPIAMKQHPSSFVSNVSSLINNVYSSSQLRFSTSQIKAIRVRLDECYNDQQYFRYFYSFQDKIKLGYLLFDIFHVVADQTAVIFKYQKYMVFALRSKIHSHFVVFFHNSRNIIYGQLANAIQFSQQYFKSQHNFQNGLCYQYTTAQIHHGYYLHAKKHGYGVTINNQGYFQGDYLNNSKNGYGKLLLCNGDKYEGGFKNNNFEGEGLYSWQNGEIYDGYFYRGLKQGFGRQSFINGDSYQGEYVNNRKEGNGIYKWKNGTVYQGSFISDMKQGYGKLTTAEGVVTLGQWYQNELTGQQILQNAGIKYNMREELPLISKFKD